MPPRQLTLALLWLALVALLAMLGLLWHLRGSAGWPADIALLLNVLLLPLPPWCMHLLCRRQQDSEAAQAAAESRTRLLAQVSHEIRTPMNAIMGMTHLALQTPLSAEQRELLGKTDAASRSLMRLINDVLDISKIEAGQMQMESAPLRLEDVVAHAIALVRPLHTRTEVQWVCEWADASLLGPRGQLRGDAPRLQQVLVNLLTHAVKFTPAGQVLLRLAAEATDDDGVPLVITVRDSGIGMSDAQLAGLNRDASPGDASMAARADGSSLGLSIARSLVQLMGGRMDVQSQPGRGSRFEIRMTLPLHTAMPPPAPAPHRLLLAEADADSCEASLALLRHLGLGDGLVAAANADALLAALASARQAGQLFDWLLLDWLLPGPGPTGAELLARLRRDHPALRVAVLMQAGQDDNLAQARVFGARALCAKPLLPGDVRRLLAEAPAAAPAGVDGESLAGLRVLLVEDHPINQEIALRLLNSRGASVDVAANGQLGLEQLQARGPDAYDLVLMDLQMPVLDGLEATRRLRALPGFADLPVLAMTAHTMPEERAQCTAAGMQGHIAKPLDLAVLVRELQQYRQPSVAGSAPALDLNAGLRQFAGQTALYQRTLRGFADQYGPGLQAWTAWLEGADWVELRRAAHTLQGLAATLGAQSLHRAALGLERCAAAADARGSAQQLARVEAVLVRLLDEIRATLPEHSQPPTAGDAGDLAELRHLLSQSDSRALDWWQAHGRHSGLNAETRQRLQQALDALDFDAAAHALKESA
ncbi:response regulator [Roseateles asaccharophilus]|uniref:histidine kinase n=1 Tax=Roseateles asaccharophilus TaxID=582607 RepID=A0ABU2A5E3_9BURK|nr:response regulator [Roseateles asaccharophilus]MDR7332415.1 signal transduction histidine kinase/CheY-like chemotaxis protein [Roseateles asaccharophilus]